MRDYASPRSSGSRFEIFRTLGGRRSKAQVRALEWTGDIDRVLPVLSRYPLPSTDIADT